MLLNAGIWVLRARTDQILFVNYYTAEIPENQLLYINKTPEIPEIHLFFNSENL